MRRLPLTAAGLLLLLCAPLEAASARLTKSDGRFHLTGAGPISVNFIRALPVLRGFADYEKWALRDINEPRAGREKAYMISIDGLRYEAAHRRFRFDYSFSRYFKGSHSLTLLVEDRLDEKPPRLIAKLETPTRLVQDVRCELTFHPSDKVPGMLSKRTDSPEHLDIELTAEARSHWLFYYLVPLRLLRGNTEDRVLKVFENADRRFSQ
ncbi:MAG: hypothetical protein ABIJ96_00810 [Elusimicrobiota bacterium]